MRPMNATKRKHAAPALRQEPTISVTNGCRGNGEGAAIERREMARAVARDGGKAQRQGADCRGRRVAQWLPTAVADNPLHARQPDPQNPSVKKYERERSTHGKC